MKITAVTEDQIIIINGVPAKIGEIGGFHMTKGEWALHFDDVKGYGEIEYLDNRPNRIITSDEFNNHYKWLIDEHKRYIKQKEAENESNAESVNSDSANVDFDYSVSNQSAS